MKKPDIIKLSEFSATTLSTLSDNTSAYIPAFISDVENYKIPVDNFIAEEMNSWKEWSEDRNSSGSNTSVYIGPNNKADASATYIMGQNNMSTSDCNTNTIIGFDNTQNNTSNTHIFGENNTVTSGVENTVIGMDNRIDTANDISIFGLNNTVSASDINNIIGLDNTLDSTSGSSIIGEKNTLSESYTNNLFGIDNSASNYTTISDIIGHSNKSTGGHNSTVVGEFNTLDGATRTYIFGNNISAHGTWDFAAIGENNSCESSTTNTVIGYENRIEGCYGNGVIGQKNILIDSYDMYILGQNNKAQNRSVYSIIVGQENETLGTDGRGQYIFGCRNKVSGGYVIGMSNSADNGGMAFGVSNNVHNGAYAIGDYNWSDQGSLTLAPACGENSANRGSIAIGWGFNNHSNSADTGSIAIGKNTYANDGAFTFGTEVSANQGSISIGRTVSAGHGSITIGFDGASAENGSFTIGKYGASAYNGSYIIGESSSASNGSMVFGKSNACADGSSISMGWNGIGASGNSITIGHDGVYSYGLNSMAIGLSGISADHSSIVFGMNSVSATSAGIAIGAQGVTADNNTFAIGYRGVSAGGAPSFAIGSQGVFAFDDGIAIGVNGVSAANQSIVIGRESASARNQSISIGKNNNYAENWGIAIGVANSAFNHSIMLGTNMATPSFARYGSIGIHAGDGSRPFTADNYSITIRSTYDEGVVTTNYGGISIGRSEGYTYVNNDSIAIGKVDAHINDTGLSPYPTNILSADNFSIAIGKAGFHPMMVNNQSTFIGNSTNASAYATNMSYVIGIAGGQYGFDGNYGHGVLSADNRSLIFGGSMNTSTIVEHDSVSIGFDNIGYYGAMMFGDSNSAYNHYSGNSPSSTWTNAYILGDFNRVENYRGILSNGEEDNKNSRTIDGIARTMSLVVGNDNKVIGYNAFSFGSQNMNGMSEYAWNGSSYSSDKDDDGFTFTFGLQNYAARNYDMAIGYSAIASGGENIVIGTPIGDANGMPTEAIGYKNISIRSRAKGVNNILIDSYNISYPQFYYDGRYESGRFAFNRIDNSKNLSFQQKTDTNRITECQNISVSCEFCKNDINDSKNLTFAIPDHVVHNEINKSNNIIVNAAAGDFDNNYLNFVDNALFASNVIGSKTIGYHYNYMFNNPSMTIYGGNISQNIIYTSRISAAGVGDMAHNIIANSIISSNNNLGAYGNNRIFGSVILNSEMNFADPAVFAPFAGQYVGYSPYNPDTYNGSLITNSFMFGTYTEGCISDCVSFGFDAEDRGYSGSPKTYRRPSFKHAYQTINFGENVLANTITTYVNGFDNELYGAENIHVIGRENYIDSNYFDGWSGAVPRTDSCNINELTVFGQANAVIKSGTASTYVQNAIYGNNNIINGSTEITDNNIIGLKNKICNIPASISQSITNIGGAYYWIESSDYASVLPVTDHQAPDTPDYDYWYGNNYASAYSSFNTNRNNRNTIIGAHSVISQAINDSYLIGNNNTVYNSIIDQKIAEYNAMTAAAPVWTAGQYDTGDIVRYNDIAYSAREDIRGSYTGRNPEQASWSWDKTSVANYTTHCQINNDVILGAYNFGIGGSNQFIAGFNNIASGHHSMAIGEELHANAFQTVIGKYNEAVEGTVRTTSAYDIATDTVQELENTGVLFVIGNGRATAYEKIDESGSAHWFNENNVEIHDYELSYPAYIERSNAMIVSANGLVSAANLATSGYGDVESTLDALNIATYENTQNINDISAAIGDIETLLAAL